MTFKDFNAGDIFTADDADLLLRQGVIIVADAAARDAIPTPSAGMRAYRADTKMIDVHNGTAWISTDGWLSLTYAAGFTSTTAGQLAVAFSNGITYLRGGANGTFAAGVAATVTTANAIPSPLRPEGVLRDSAFGQGGRSAGIEVAAVVNFVQNNTSAPAWIAAAKSWPAVLA